MTSIDIFFVLLFIAYNSRREQVESKASMVSPTVVPPIRKKTPFPQMFSIYYVTLYASEISSLFYFFEILDHFG